MTKKRDLAPTRMPHRNQSVTWYLLQIPNWVSPS